MACGRDHAALHRTFNKLRNNFILPRASINQTSWAKLKALTLPHPDPKQHEAVLRYVERNVALPVKCVVIQVLFYYFYFSNWFDNVTRLKPAYNQILPQDFVFSTVRSLFIFYVLLNAVVAVLLIRMKHLPLRCVRNTAYCSSLLDALFLAALTVVTGGSGSILFWVFLGLILRNSISHPETLPQISLNLLTSACFVLGGTMEIVMRRVEVGLLDKTVRTALEQGPQEINAEPFLLRTFLLLLVAACCYGLQLLKERQRRIEEEARESELRQEQLHATGRLAAEIAHQLKNPLGIINNAAFTLQRTVKEGKTITQQIQIIREEVDRSDRILTELMGYARLNEGRVEKLDVVQEMETAIGQVFPDGARYETELFRDYANDLPALLAQRVHFSEILVNILQNAREALNGAGKIWISIKVDDHYSLRIDVQDNGPGIPPDKVTRIFEAYFTTKEKGSGLGLSIVKHNTEMYNGKVEVRSTEGQGTLFTVKLPSKTVIKFRK